MGLSKDLQVPTLGEHYRNKNSTTRDHKGITFACTLSKRVYRGLVSFKESDFVYRSHKLRALGLDLYAPYKLICGQLHILDYTKWPKMPGKIGLMDQHEITNLKTS